MSTTTVIAKINVYLADDGNWYAARWIDGVYDGCDVLDDVGTEEEALSAAEAMPLTGVYDRAVRRVLGVGDAQL